MTFYIGVDFHPYQQTLCWCDEETGETGTLKLTHDIEKIREFYSSIDKRSERDLNGMGSERNRVRPAILTILHWHSDDNPRSLGRLRH